MKFADFGPDCVSALDLINAGQYEQRLGSYWLKKLPEASARLEQGGRALDFGCGVGRVAMAIARAGDRLEDNIHPLGTVYYGFNLFHCMTQSLAAGGPGLGTCMGPAQTMSLLRRAGFNEVEPLDIKSQTHLFYAARA